MAGERELGVGGEDLDVPLWDGRVELFVEEDGFTEVELCGYVLFLGLRDQVTEGRGDPD